MFATLTYMRVGLVTLVFASACLFAACNSKQKSDQEWVDSVMNALDSIPDETIDFSLQEDTTISIAVDENFNDFLYNFMHNSRFRVERVQWPLRMVNADNHPVREINRGSELKDILSLVSSDYYVMLLNSISQLESDPASNATHASMKMVSLDEAIVQHFDFSRDSGEWRLMALRVDDFEDNHIGSFYSFYNRFLSDSTFQTEHIAQPLEVSLPDDEEENAYIEGTIDADQFPLFSPELPSGVMMVVDLGLLNENPHRIVMVKCGVATSMMDILTFERDGDEWRLTKLEE